MIGRRTLAAQGLSALPDRGPAIFSGKATAQESAFKLDVGAGLRQPRPRYPDGLAHHSEEPFLDGRLRSAVLAVAMYAVHQGARW